MELVTWVENKEKKLVILELEEQIVCLRAPYKLFPRLSGVQLRLVVLFTIQPSQVSRKSSAVLSTMSRVMRLGQLEKSRVLPKQQLKRYRKLDQKRTTVLHQLHKQPTRVQKKLLKVLKLRLREASRSPKALLSKS